MAQSAVIVNPIINSPFAEPQRHFKFDDSGITNEVEQKRRSSSYFIPIAHGKRLTDVGQRQRLEGQAIGIGSV